MNSESYNESSELTINLDLSVTYIDNNPRHPAVATCSRIFPHRPKYTVAKEKATSFSGESGPLFRKNLNVIRLFKWS